MAVFSMLSLTVAYDSSFPYSMAYASSDNGGGVRVSGRSDYQSAQGTYAVGTSSDCSNRTRLHPDTSKLQSRRKAFFGGSQGPHSAIFAVYAQSVRAEVQPAPGADAIVKQLADDLVCELPFEKAQGWLRLVPQATKNLEWMVRAENTINTWVVDDNANPASFAEVLEQLKAAAASHSAEFDLNFVSSKLFESVKEAANRHGSKEMIAELEKAERRYEGSYNDSKNYLKFLRAKLYIDNGKPAQAEALLVDLKSTDHPNVKGNLTWLVRNYESAIEASKQAANPAPDFSSEVVDGQGEGTTLSLSDYKGQVVVLDFWQTWCGPCLIKLPKLQELQQQSRGKVQVVGISQEEGASTLGQLKRVRKSKGVDFPQLLDSSKKISESYGVTTYPYVVIVGKDGSIHNVLSGAQGDRVFEEVASLLE